MSRTASSPGSTSRPTTRRSGPDRPEYEPRGCPRGAAFSWYTYSPTRVRYPYVRGVLLEMYREAKARLGDPVAGVGRHRGRPGPAPALQVGPRQGRPRARQLGRGDRDDRRRTRAHDQAVRPGPGRGVLPDPGDVDGVARRRRPVHVADRRRRCCRSTTGTPTCRSPRRRCSATRPTCPSPGTGGTPAYLIMWGSNIPVTRTPDAHWMAEARYRGQKVIAVSPDYADNVKFADEWLPAAARHRRRAGDGDGPRHAQGVLRRPAGAVLHRLRQAATPTCRSWSRLEPVGDGDVPAGQVPHRRRSRRERPTRRGVQDRPARRATGEPVVPNGSLGFRYGDAGAGRWNLDLGDVDPLLTAAGGPTRRSRCRPAPVRRAGRCGRRAAPRCAGATVAGHLVTTVFDLMLAQYGVAATGLPGEWPTRLRRRRRSRTRRRGRSRSPACPAPKAARIAREFADNAEESRGRSMILMGAGTNHWFHSDTIYRAFLTLTTLTGCQGVNGGGWAHYVGQEKCRPITGWAAARVRPGLVPPAAADDPDRVLVPAHRPVALRPVQRRRARRRRWRRAVRRQAHRRPDRAVGAAWAGCRRTRRSTATRSTSPTRRRGRRTTRSPSTSSTS